MNKRRNPQIEITNKELEELEEERQPKEECRSRNRAGSIQTDSDKYKGPPAWQLDSRGRR